MSCLTVGWREHYGVWGGLSAGERRRIRRRERNDANARALVEQALRRSA